MKRTYITNGSKVKEISHETFIDCLARYSCIHSFTNPFGVVFCLKNEKTSRIHAIQILTLGELFETKETK